MKIKISEITIDTSNIRYLHSKYKKLNNGLNKVIRPHYSIEFNDNTYLVITKKEYKYIKKILKRGE